MKPRDQPRPTKTNQDHQRPSKSTKDHKKTSQNPKILIRTMKDDDDEYRRLSMKTQSGVLWHEEPSSTR